MKVYRRTAATLFADIDQDVVALQPDRGFCFGMEEVTAEVWRILAEPTTEQALCDRLTALYEVDADTCRSDINLLLQQMLGEELIEVIDLKPASAGR